MEGRKYNDLPIVHLFGFAVERHCCRFIVSPSLWRHCLVEGRLE